MLDFFGQTLCIGDRVAFTSSTNDQGLLMGQITGFTGEEPNRRATIWTDGNRETSKRTSDIAKEPA